MFQVQCLKSTKNKTTEIYSKYSIGPFLKGQSTTIGNALRRVLLSNLNGIAITGVRITGIDHEFSTIPNVKEDIVDILLNLKQIVLKGDITEPTLARLNIKEPGIVLAKDIELPSNISIIDPKQYIASLSDKGNLEIEFLITKGQNYFTSDKLNYTIPEQFLGVDAIFMPVTKVNFFCRNFKKHL
jgi:DNA-directed RNA polymerase subunit alpha